MGCHAAHFSRTIMQRAADFEAIIQILTPAEGGRRSPVFNGIRWDFQYVEHPGCFMIWPDFMDDAGRSLGSDKPLPSPCPARMIIVVDEMREQVHRALIQPGVRFNCVEGD